jgi:hypothetical protein
MHQIDRASSEAVETGHMSGRIERRSSIVNGSNTVRVIAGIVLALIVAGIGIGAYQLGVQAGQVQEAGAAVAPAVAPYAYYGWHPFGFGFGFFGFFGTLLFVILIFVLIRAIVFGGRGRRWGGPGYGGGPRGWRGGPWESHARDTFEDWHREAHGGSSTGTRPESGSRSDDPNAA